MRMLSIIAIATAGLLMLNACGKKDEAHPPPPPAPTPAPAPPPPPPLPPAPEGVTLGAISLGSAIDTDKKVTQAGETFGKEDTLYVSIETTGTGKATLKARWTFHMGEKEALVKEDVQTIDATGPAHSEFHVSKPSGWPVGDYRVEVFIDDKSVGTKTFNVK